MEISIYQTNMCAPALTQQGQTLSGSSEYSFTVNTRVQSDLLTMPGIKQWD